MSSHKFKVGASDGERKFAVGDKVVLLKTHYTFDKLEDVLLVEEVVLDEEGKAAFNQSSISETAQ